MTQRHIHHGLRSGRSTGRSCRRSGAPLVSIGPGLHAEVLTDAFVIVAIGGMGSFAGAFIGALLVGQANAFGVLVFPQMAIVVPFALMALILSCGRAA